MAIAQDAVTGITTSSSGVSSYTFSHTMGSVSNGVLLVTVDCDDGDHVTGVTYNGVAMTQLVKVTSPGSLSENYIYGLLAPATGTNNVIVSRSTSVGTITAGAVSFSGVKQSGLPDASNTATRTSGTTLTTMVTTVADNSWIIGFFQNDNQGITVGTNSTIINTGPNSGGPWSMFKYSGNPKTPAGSQSMDMNGTTGNASSVAVSIAPALSTVTATITYLVVAGGGGGGGENAGGGGAGGYRQSTVVVSNGTSYTVVIGSGGTAGANGGGVGGSGGNSSVNFDSGIITSTGGGGGGSTGNGVAGGSGGGGSNTGTGGAGTGGGQGNNGGAGHSGGGTNDEGGGGGGANAVGGDGNGTTKVGGVGGAGTAFNPGSGSVTYAGGGGGGVDIRTIGGAGGAAGSGGGGAGAYGGAGAAATANTGGGGGGGGYNSGLNDAGGAGGSGIVIFYAPIGTITSATGGTHTTGGGNDIWTFTSGGTWTPTIPVAATGSFFAFM